jgi:hypothetical protein
MERDFYKNKDIKTILGIPERRIINLTDKQVIKPFVDSTGAGSQRRYNYTNLLEFSLAEALFKFGLGIHLVRRILGELRQQNHFPAWAEDWDTYYIAAAKKQIQWFKKQSEVNPHFSSVILSDGKVLNMGALDLNNHKDLELVKDKLKPKRPSGLLVVKFEGDGSVEIKVIPWDRENYLATLFLGEYAYRSAGLLIIDIGRVKAQVDEMINRS